MMPYIPAAAGAVRMVEEWMNERIQIGRQSKKVLREKERDEEKRTTKIGND